MNFIDAVHAMVHDYPGGSESLGPRMGTSAAVLRNKVNPNNATHHASVGDLDKMMALTNDYRPLYALAANHGHACVLLVDGPIGDVEIIERITAVWKEVGDVGGKIQSILSGHRVEPRAVGEFAVEVEEAIRALLALQASLVAIQEK